MKKTAKPEGKGPGQQENTQIKRQHEPLLPLYVAGTCCLYRKKNSNKCKQAEKINGTERSSQA